MSRLRTNDYLRFLFLVYGLRRGTLTRSWSDPAIADLQELHFEPGAGRYPLDFSRDDHPCLLSDEQGIPIIDYANLGRQHNPWFVGHVALGCHTRWRRTGRPELLARFRRLADWFVSCAEPCSAGVRWLYHFDWFGCDAPWFSGLSQAHAISVLIRAAYLFGDEKYEDVARRGVEVMIGPTEQGGTAYVHRDGATSFEEHVSDPPGSILNGHLFSLFAAREASQFFRDARYQYAFRSGVRFVEQTLPQYDLGYWSCYSLQRTRSGLPDIASRHYHDVHIAQLRVLEAITGEAVFRDAAAQFTGYQRSGAARRKATWMKRLVKLIR